MGPMHLGGGGENPISEGKHCDRERLLLSKQKTTFDGWDSEYAHLFLYMCNSQRFVKRTHKFHKNLKRDSISLLRYASSWVVISHIRIKLSPSIEEMSAVAELIKMVNEIQLFLEHSNGTTQLQYLTLYSITSYVIFANIK